MKRTLYFIMGLFWLTALVFWYGNRDALAENIDPLNNGSQYAYGENVGWFNAEPNGDGGDGVERPQLLLPLRQAREARRGQVLVLLRADRT